MEKLIFRFCLSSYEEDDVAEAVLSSAMMESIEWCFAVNAFLNHQVSVQKMETILSSFLSNSISFSLMIFQKLPMQH